MDKNQFTGLILMVGLLVIYFTFFSTDSPTTEESAPQETEQIMPVDTTMAEEEAFPDSVKTEEGSQKYGIFSFAADIAEEEKIIENEDLRITFTNKGGKIKEVMLRAHKDYLGRPLKIMDSSKSSIHLQVDHLGKKIDLSDLGFELATQTVGDTTLITYKLSNASFSLEQQYRIPASGFQVFYDVKSRNLNSVIDPNDIRFTWNHNINRAESNLENSRLNSNIRYLRADGEYDELDEQSNEFEEETINNPLKWLSFKQKFFTTGLIANASFKSGHIATMIDLTDSATVKNGLMQLLIPYTEFLSGYGHSYFFGPNNHAILKSVSDEFEENLDMGWGPLPIINKYLIIPIFHFLEGLLANYGIIIFIIVIIIRLILAPLTYKSHISMAKMRVLKPELDEIKEKHDGDMQKTQQEQMQLYRKVGINPLSGCIPVLLQMPILFALFFFFPNAVELRQQSFLWAHDLSTYDSIFSWSANIPLISQFYGNHVSLFTLLMTVSTLLTTWSHSQITTVQNSAMKTMQYIMPIMFLFVLNSYASGLTFYYFVTNMLTFGQVILFRKLIDENNIKQTLEENRKKNANKKKSKFQNRLEEAIKANQEAQRTSKKKK